MTLRRYICKYEAESFLSSSVLFLFLHIQSIPHYSLTLLYGSVVQLWQYDGTCPE